MPCLHDSSWLSDLVAIFAAIQRDPRPWSFEKRYSESYRILLEYCFEGFGCSVAPLSRPTAGKHNADSFVTLIVFSRESVPLLVVDVQEDARECEDGHCSRAAYDHMCDRLQFGRLLCPLTHLCGITALGSSVRDHYINTETGAITPFSPDPDDIPYPRHEDTFAFDILSTVGLLFMQGIVQEIVADLTWKSVGE